MENREVLVSISCITYNHASFIAETLAGFEAQQVNFPVEVIIHDDFSTDGTRDILLKYKEQSKYPVTLLFPDENRYSKGERIFPKTFIKAKGKYIATCEGDDYWVDPLKLKEQVTFLEENQNYNLITAQAQQFRQNTSTFIELPPQESFSFTYKDMILRNQCATCTTMFRNYISPQFKVFEGWGTDSQYWIRALGKEGKGYFLAKKQAVYRRHDAGLTHASNKANSNYSQLVKASRRKIEKARFWDDYFGNEAKKEVLQVEYKFRKRMLSLALKRNKLADIPKFTLLYLFVKLKMLVA